MHRKLYVQIGEREREIDIDDADGQLAVRVDGEPRRVQMLEVGDGKTYALRVGDRVWEIVLQRGGEGLALMADGDPFLAVVRDEREHRVMQANTGKRAGRTEVKAPMPGLVTQVVVSPGDAVLADTRLLSLEAMKMENEIRTPGPGTVTEVRVTPGQKVEQGYVLVVLE